MVKHVKNLENLLQEMCTKIEVTMLCGEEKLKKELKIIELRFMKETDRNNLLFDPVECDADREKCNDLVKKLKYINVVKREFNVTEKKH